MNTCVVARKQAQPQLLPSNYDYKTNINPFHASKHFLTHHCLPVTVATIRNSVIYTRSHNSTSTTTSSHVPPIVTNRHIRFTIFTMSPPNESAASTRTKSSSSYNSAETDITAIYRGERPQRVLMLREARLRTPSRRRQKLQDEENAPAGPLALDGAPQEDEWYETRSRSGSAAAADTDGGTSCLA